MPAKSASEVVKKSQAKNKDAGGGRLTFNLSPDELEEWQALLAKVPEGRGQLKSALMLAIRAGRKRNSVSKADVLAWIEAST